MTPNDLYIIGLTGNIASGKSVVAQILAGLGAEVIDADKLAHEVMRAGTPVWKNVVDEFGAQILQAGGEIDREVLGNMVFADPSALRRLEAIVHPAVIAESEGLLRKLRAQAACSAGDFPLVVVLEAIKLIEAGMDQHCNELWVVTCAEDQQLERLMRTRGLSTAQARLRIDSQPPQQGKVRQADVVIDNSGSLTETRVQVLREWERIRSEHTQSATVQADVSSGGGMSSWRRFVDEHPFLTMWAVLAVGMVIIFVVTSRDVDLLPSQRLFMALACVGVAGLCSWIISWE